MAQRSNLFPHLNSIQIFDFADSLDDFDSLLTSTPYAKEICIVAKVAFHSGTLAGLGSGRICPNLEIIELYTVLGAREILEMVRVRQENAHFYSNGEGDGIQVKAFTNVTIVADDWKPIGADFLVQSLRKSGVKANVSWQCLSKYREYLC